MIKEFVILGGGSAYTPGLLQAIIHHGAALNLARIRLYDTDQDHLELVGRLGQAMARSAGVSFQVEAVASLESALQGADVVLNSTRPGGFEARRLDETLPLALGIPGQETVGPGGLFFALRSVPEALRVARALKQFAPDALLLNYTNPSNIVTQALTDSGAVPVLGLCDQSDEDLMTLGQALGHEGEKYQFRCNGLNHATWYSEIHFSNQSLPALAAHVETPAGLNAEHRLRFELSLEMARQAPGYWPNSYLPYYTAPEKFVRLSAQQGPRSDAITAKLPTYYAHFREEAVKEHPVLMHHRGTAGFGDLAVTVLQALSQQATTPLVLNVANRGATSLFDANTVVETWGTLGDQGWGRVQAPLVPPAHLPLLKQLETYQHLAAEAARTGQDAAIVSALAANPLVGSLQTANALWDMARKQYGALLPMLK
jgi:6-phospho-beta-glucosidase